mgnify:CR=1 FL=1
MIVPLDRMLIRHVVMVQEMQENLNAELYVMPKMKTNSGAAKRFKKTASGYKRKQSFKSHILTKKPTKRKRQLRPMMQVAASDKSLVDRMLRV